MSLITPHTQLQRNFVGRVTDELSYEVHVTDVDGKPIDFVATRRELSELVNTFQARIEQEQHIVRQLDKQVSKRSVVSRIPVLRRLSHG